jgi:hypothetical protein
LPDRITAHVYFLLAGFFGWEITEGRSIYRRQSFGTTADMFREGFFAGCPGPAKNGCLNALFTRFLYQARSAQRFRPWSPAFQGMAEPFRGHAAGITIRR